MSQPYDHRERLVPRPIASPFLQIARRIAWILAILNFLALSARAHKPSDSYLFLTLDGTRLNGQWDLAVRDLDHAFGLDQDEDGAITWAEVQSRQEAIDRYALATAIFTLNGHRVQPRLIDHLIDYHSDGCYLVLMFQLESPSQIKTLDLSYQTFFDMDPQHRGLLRLQWGDATQTAIFSPAQPSHLFQFSEPQTQSEQFVNFLREGIWHIWLGYDHILFLLALLIPAVLRRHKSGWQPVASFKKAFLNVFKIVTAFTVAHSLTLALAAFNLVQLPPRLIESAIAASVVIVALNNIFAVFSERGWLIAFGFGLIHGFGFANVLRDLGLAQGSLAMTLLGFNLGVEVGQLGIVAAFLPLAFAFREQTAYQWFILRAGSALLVLIAGTWMVERILDFKVLPF